MQLTTEHINHVLALARKGLGVVANEASTEILCKCTEAMQALATWADEQVAAQVDRVAPIEKATP